MYSEKKALRLLQLVAACLLVADYLPVWQKLWFVSESGKYGTSPFGTIILLVALFMRWRGALNLVFAWLALRLCFTGYILYHTIPHGGPVVGFLLTGALYVLVLRILCNSSHVRYYLNNKSASLAQE